MLSKKTDRKSEQGYPRMGGFVFKCLSVLISVGFAGQLTASSDSANVQGKTAQTATKTKVITGEVPAAVEKNSAMPQSGQPAKEPKQQVDAKASTSNIEPTETSIKTATNAAQTETAPALKPAAVVPVVAGPEKPIGHSLKTPEAQKRIEMMMANAHQDGKIGPLVAAPAPAKATAPLVNGRYGFSANGIFQGTPKALVSLGNNTPAYALIVEKLHHRLSVFRMNESGKYEIVKTYRAISGRDPGDKIARGDLRTPEGIYFVTGRLNDEELPPKYGRMAFTLDYPNIYDKRQRKSGYGIWIHSTDDPSRLQKPFDTEGCVVLSNEDISDLEKYIDFFEVPVVITKEMTSVNDDELIPTRRKALEMVDAWRKAWESSSFESYMSYYSKNFRSLGKNKDQWQSFKSKLSDERGNDIQVTISEPKIVAFEDQLLVVFLQDYKSKKHSDFGRKFLYLQWEGDRYRIIAEKWYKSPKSETAQRALRSPAKQL
jgi:murein L,D-transpeptidase YafK